jgi:hypothetical protein
MTIYDFMGQHPFIAFCLIILAAFSIETVAGFLHRVIYTVVVVLPNRFLRHMNIRKHGYPPPHCDADGDFKPHPRKE